MSGEGVAQRSRCTGFLSYTWNSNGFTVDPGCCQTDEWEHTARAERVPHRPPILCRIRTGEAAFVSAREQGSFRVGEWLVEPLSNQMSLHDRQVSLRSQVMELLVYLANLRGRVVSLEVMHDELWKGKVVSTGTIYNCIAELRQAFALGHPQGHYVETIPKKGYRLAVPVTFQEPPPQREYTAAVVAILPLHNLSGPEDEYLCDGISEEVLHSLSKVAALKVVSALSLKGLNLDNREVARRFEADYLLAGSLQRSGSRLRLGFRLEDAGSGHVMWSEHRDEEFSDIFEVQENVARQVVEALSVHPSLAGLLSAVPGDAGTRNPEALNEFLLGRHALSIGAATEYAVAIARFERAVNLDPDFARAHYCLYLACYFRTRFQHAPAGLIHQARLAASRARECGYRPAVPWIHIHRRLNKDARIGTLEQGREAIAKFRSGDPEWGSFAYEQLSWVLSASGFFEAAHRFAQRALDSPSLNFQDSDVDEELPNWSGAAGHLQEAIHSLSSLIQKDPRRAWYRYDRTTLYCRTAQYDKAEQELAALTALGAPCRNADITLAFWRGDPDSVRAQLALNPSGFETRPTFECIVQAMAGNLDRAAELFDLATDARGDHAFVDLGYARAKLRCALTRDLVSQLESHPRLQALFATEGIDGAWRQWLLAELNSISGLTGIAVTADEDR